MKKYELTISESYVPTWGVVEAVREFFQNALDEETADPVNKMFFTYDEKTQTLRVGNKHGKLNHKTLLFGYTDKNDNPDMIGNHGEGYKIATVVLLRLGKGITFYNYGCREVWRPRFVESRRYGTKLPTFFVDTKHIWESVPDSDLVIEITGITPEEYEEITRRNLHISGQDCRKISTSYGDLLMDDDYKGKIFVGGLFICQDERLMTGIDFKPRVVKIERDRNMVDSFDVQWYAARMIEQSRDKGLIDRAMSEYSGYFIRYDYLNNLGDEICADFFEKYGYDAVPVSSQEDVLACGATNTVIVSETKRNLLLSSRYYKDHSKSKVYDKNTLSGQLHQFIFSLQSKLTSYELNSGMELVAKVKELEDLYSSMPCNIIED